MENNNELVLSETSKHELSTNDTFANAENFTQIFNIGKMFASSNLVPQNYQGKPMDCTIAVDMANRMCVSPMMVMQNLYVVKGKPSWSGQACTAMISGSGQFKNVKHIYTGEKGTDSWGCYVEATRVSDNEVIKGAEVTMKMAKAEGWVTKNPKWTNMPELMLAYRASAFFARVNIPSALMGMAVEGEVEDATEPIKQDVPDVFSECEVVKDVVE